MFRAKSIDELYEEVRDYDLVICNDAPLALALNNRLDKPRVGVFAITPRQLASDLSIDILGVPTLSDIEVVRRISKNLGYPMRFVHGEIENIKTIRRYSSEVKKYLRGSKSKDIYDEYIRIPTLEKAMDSFDSDNCEFFKDKSIALIGDELFDSLDKKMNPPPANLEYIDLFSDESTSAYIIPEFRELSNDHQVALNAVSLIDKDNAADFALVLDVNGKIADAVRSELYRKGLPFINKLSIRDLNNIRDYLEFINRSLNFNITKVGQVRELLQTYGGFIKPVYDEYLIENYTEITDNPHTVELLRIMSKITDYTYGQVCNEITGKEGAQVKLMLSQLELTDKKVNVSDTADMVYSVNNFELKHNEQIPPAEKEGVLIVDCKNSVYIDRPVVIYLGLGPEWEKDLSDLNLTNTSMKGDLDEMNVKRFQILLQQGSSRIYICNGMRNGKPTKPCSYFEKADGELKVYERFSDISGCIKGAWHSFPMKKKVRAGGLHVSKQKRDFEFSNSSFNDYISCPRKFMFGRVIKAPDKEHNAIGSYLHNYAEFRVCYPEKSKELGQEFFVNEISRRCTPLFSPDVRGIRESKIRAAVMELDELIETYGFCDNVRIIKKKRDINDRNIFFEMFGKNEEGSDSSEIKVVSRDRHMNGKMDFISGNSIFDYKTGGTKSASDVIDNMNLDKPSDYGKNFQCLFYLSLLKDEGIENPEFSFFYTSANELNVATGNITDLESAMLHIKMIKDKREFIDRFLFATEFEGVGSYQKLADRWGEFIAVLDDIGMENAVSDIEVSTKIIARRMGIEGKTNEKMIVGALKKFKYVLDRDYQRIGNTIYITEGLLESFRELVKRSFDQIMENFNGEFKAKPLMKCEKCEYRDMCTDEPLGGDSDE